MSGLFRLIRQPAIAAAAAGLLGMTTAGAQAQIGPPCDTGAHRAFDFWIGEWEVRLPDGKLAGTNRITVEQGGCALREQYSTERGYRGQSINVYDMGRKVWHQTWVDSGGVLLLLEGGWRDTRMVLEGRSVGTLGSVTLHRISWTPNPDGSVRQFWESTDKNGQWITTFDGRYTRLRSGAADAR